MDLKKWKIFDENQHRAVVPCFNYTFQLVTVYIFATLKQFIKFLNKKSMLAYYFCCFFSMLMLKTSNSLIIHHTITRKPIFNWNR